MSKPLIDPIDRRMVPRTEGSFNKRRWWMRSRRNLSFSAIVLIDVLILFVVRYGINSDSDAAGNGMSRAIDAALFDIGRATVCFVTFLYVIIPSRKVRLGLTVLIVMITMALIAIIA